MPVTEYSIAGVPLNYVSFAWPMYRGTVALPVEIDYWGERHDELQAAVSAANGVVDIVVTAPAQPGTRGQQRTETIGGVVVERMAKLNDMRGVMVCYDKRRLLERRVGDKDFRIQFRDGFLNGTEFDTVESALVELVASLDVLAENMADDAYARLTSIALRDGLQYAGTMASDELGAILDTAGVDLTVTRAGKFRFVDRLDVADDPELPAENAYSWYAQPGWVTQKLAIFGKPEKVRCYYWERHTVEVKGSNNDGSVSATFVAPELEVQLEQVYKSDGQFFTLAELLKEYGFSPTAINEASIAKAFMTGTMQGTAVEANGTDTRSAVIEAIKDGWRRLWRLKYPEPQGMLGGWSDWAFGQQDENGNVLQDRAVACDWVEFLAYPDLTENGEFVGSAITRSHARGAAKDCPFIASWEAGPEMGVIRISQTERRDGALILPGVLTKELKVEQKDIVTDAKGWQDFIAKNYKVIESEDRGKAEFDKSFMIRVYMVGTRRMPNNESRWHNESVDAYAAGAGYVELVPPELHVIRDYPDEQNGKPRLADGGGAILNKAAITADAVRRTELWKLDYSASPEGSGVAEGIGAFGDVNVQGAVKGVVLLVDEEVVRTEVRVGNLADNNQRLKVAQRRAAKRGYTESGKTQAV